MTVFVDELRHYPNAPFGYSHWAHMWADSIDELHNFALFIGLKRRWFQSHPTLWHYDITETKHNLAIASGAKLLIGREARIAIHARVSGGK